MSLFTKGIESIEFYDVHAFFDRKLREGLRIDYKEDFPSDLAKIVIAFANTAGGIILIGIRANRNTNIPVEIVGVDLRSGIEEQVTDITLSNIRPPISPEVKVCPYKSNENLAQEDRAVVVIRVPESELAPHIHTQNNTIWVRKHNKCDLASLETIEQLLTKRDRSSEIRQKMSMEENETITKAVQELRMYDEQRRYHVINISPLYPLRTIKFDKSMDDFLASQVSSVGRVNISTPRVGGIEFRFRSSLDNTTLRFFSISRNASLINIEPLEMQPPKGIYIERVVQVLAQMLRASVNIFERLEYFGKLLIKISVGNVLGLEFQNLIPNTHFPEHYFCQELNIEIEEIRSLDEVKEQETEILHSVYNNLLRAFKISLENAILTQRLDWLLRHLP